MDFSRSGYLCFSYSENEFPDGPYDYFRSFPVIKFELGSTDKSYVLEWYPSEYLYREKATRYCVALDIDNGSELIIGGTLMRQHNFVFDVDNNVVGMARASCSDDENQIKHEQELSLAGQKLNLANKDGVCSHDGFQKRTPRQEHLPNPQPRLDLEEDIGAGQETKTEQS